MDGYSDQWSGNGYSGNNVFYDQLQQHAAHQQPPVRNPQYHQYHDMNSQPRAHQPIEVVVPSPTSDQLHYQRPPFQQPYQYDQQMPSHPAVNYQHMYQPLPQFDGTMNGHTSPTVRPPHVPVQNGAHFQNGMSSQPIPQPTPMPAHVPASTTPNPRHDYAQILLVLAEEYIEASIQVEEESEEHLKLISFALGCMESVLNNFQLPPLKEAQISLRYAQMLYEKTENYDEAERTLTKAIETCERNSYMDLKYSLTLLSAKVLFQTKEKAAIKAMQSSIADMHAYGHVAWEYSFRYELAMLHLAASTPDLHSAILEMDKIENLAERNEDKSMAVFAAASVGILHLRTCNKDAISDAQRAVARLRSSQSDPNLETSPQIRIMTEFVDLSCSIRRCAPAESNGKRKAIHNLWLQCQEEPSWTEDGNVIYVPVKQSSLRDVALQQGGIIVEHNGKSAVPFAWCDKHEISSLELLLAAACQAHKNSLSSGTSENFIKAGLLHLEKATGPTLLDRSLLQCRFYIDTAFLQCMEGKWLTAKANLQNAIKLLQTQHRQWPQSIICAVNYLRGAIQQGQGNLDQALKIWKSPTLRLNNYLPKLSQDKTKVPRRHQDLDFETCRNLAILACMNRLFIIDDKSHPEHGDKDRTLAQLTDFVRGAEDRNISTAQMLVYSLLAQSGIWGTKEGVLKALNAAKQISNQQIIALVLTVMQQAFFLGATHDNAKKCVDAVAVQARAWRNPTWLHVSQGIQAESLRFMGQFAESANKMEEAKKSWQDLPAGIKSTIDWQSAPAEKTVIKAEDRT